MKSIFIQLLSLFCLLSGVSCGSKTKDTPTPTDLSGELKGKWNLDERYGESYFPNGELYRKATIPIILPEKFEVTVTADSWLTTIVDVTGDMRKDSMHYSRGGNELYFNHSLDNNSILELSATKLRVKSRFVWASGAYDIYEDRYTRK